METTLETLISRGAVDGRLLTLLQQSLPDRLDDVPDGFRLTARDVVVDGRSLRLTTPITRGEGNAVADWGRLMLRVLAVSSVKPRRLRRIARAAAQPPGAGGGNIRTNKRYKSATKVSIIRRKCFESQFKSRQIRRQFLVQSAEFFRNSLKTRSGGRFPS